MIDCMRDQPAPKPMPSAKLKRWANTALCLRLSERSREFHLKLIAIPFWVDPRNGNGSLITCSDIEIGRLAETRCLGGLVWANGAIIVLLIGHCEKQHIWIWFLFSISEAAAAAVRFIIGGALKWQKGIVNIVPFKMKLGKNPFADFLYCHYCKCEDIEVWNLWFLLEIIKRFAVPCGCFGSRAATRSDK